MHLVHQTTSNADRYVAAGITAFLLAGMLVGLQFANLPKVEQKTDVYEEINWTRFTPKVKKIVEVPTPKPIKTVEPVKFEPPPQAPEPKPVQKIDLTSLKASFEPVVSPSRNLKAQRNSDPAATTNANSKISLKKSSALAGLNTLLGESSKSLAVPNRTSKGRGGSGAPRLKTGSGTSLDVGDKPGYGNTGLSLSAPESKENDGGAVEIGMLDLSRMGDDFADLSPIYHELIEWMKKNPAAFPEVVDRFMEKAPGDLTSHVTFQMGGRQFEMYLLCKEQLFEVRVCLIEGNESTYLIDRGFKESSSFLRVGSVSRVPNGKILSFGTTRKAASNRRTTEFYQVFLSWWDSIVK